MHASRSDEPRFLEVAAIGRGAARLEAAHVTLDLVLDREGRQESHPTDEGHQGLERSPQCGCLEVMEHVGGDDEVKRPIQIQLIQRLERAEMQVAPVSPAPHRPLAAVETDVARLRTEPSQDRLPAPFARPRVHDGPQWAGEQALRDGDREGYLAVKLAARSDRVSPITIPALKIRAVVLLAVCHGVGSTGCPGQSGVSSPAPT